MIKSKIVLLSALVSCALISGCKEENKTNVSIEFMHSSVEQERQAVISKLIARFEKENPGITVKQVPVEEDAYNTKVITLSRSGSLPEVIETSHDYAKVMDKEQLIDRKAVATVISNVGEGAFYDGVLRIVRTEDGSAWTGVPVSAWIGGIWYRKDVLAKAGLEEPKNWQQLLDVAQKLNDPANKKYGIALPTAESVLTEQSFSQFALSNQANVFNAEGKITLDTPEMMQALTYYRDLAANTMPGSNDIMEVKDAFMNGTAPMAIYSTYILPAVIKEGDPKNVGFVVPTEKNSAVYGMLTSLTITAGQKTEETEAAEKFVTFMEQADNIADWVMMSPGAALPVNKAVVTTATWKDNDVIKALGELPNQLMLDYALYHLRIMTPAHDERSSIAAKGLTGEGYKGHVFWDTEVFLLPFHLFSDPTVARSLLRYRWHNLPGAQEKARRNGWQGALFPWESARSGEEETPEFAAINIRTGLRQKVASAQAEHHLVADIAWAVIQYWQTTGDESFIAHEGMALLLETAKFWISRAVRVNDRLEIHDVIGPDEYTEHVNNNAYTSYMARYNVQQALNIARQFGCSDDAFIHRAEMFLKELWMPEIQPDGVLPQDDSFMAKPAINLAKYKAAAGKQTILLDYSRAEVNEMQILKQADVVMLNYMLPEQFSVASCLANLQFYEPRTIHDSSLSKAIHGIVAARCGLLTQSYQFWREGTEIDLGADPHSCDDGIHAAATGAIWLGAIQGFAGVSVRDGELHLNPALPEQWQQLSFPLFWQGCELQVTLDAQRIAIRTSAPVSLRLNGQLITVAEESVFCLGDFILPFNGTATKHQEDE
ncbi:TPA: extracellular solute-binding protein [Escherichia coli]|nr:extracellular solute-binding protein [Escherichia coli]HDV5067844.1 extracellular solute-binding protein [Escherichia coli]HDV5114398.1 extracellular solute-binding protein [Escherichia coli]HDV5119075.1 extracellular solute-binding protein [Escherichia coli]